MTFIVKDRVCETTTTTGTGTLTLAGAVAGYQAWSAIGNANTAPYFIEAIDADGLPTGAWEAGIGTYTLSGTTLARTLVMRSSNSDAAVNFAAGTKRVFCEWPADLLMPGQYFDFRLTTESGVGVSISDRTSQGTIYLTNWNGNRMTLWNGSAEVTAKSGELSLALSSLTSGKNYDVFVYLNAGTPALELSAAWTNDSTPADAVSVHSETGRWTKTSDPTRLLVGTIRATGTTTTEFSVGKRFVGNVYNRVPFTLYKAEATSHSYNSTTWRGWNAGDHRFEWVSPLPHAVEASISAVLLNSASYPAAGLGIDWTSGSPGNGNFTAASTVDPPLLAAVGNGALLARGYHYCRLIEALLTGSTSSTYTRAEMKGSVLL